MLGGAQKFTFTYLMGWGRGERHQSEALQIKGKKNSKKPKQGLLGVQETMAADDPIERRKVGETWNALTGPDP